MIEVPEFGEIRPQFKEVIAFVRNSLFCDAPAAFLSLDSGQKKNSTPGTGRLSFRWNMTKTARQHLLRSLITDRISGQTCTIGIGQQNVAAHLSASSNKS
jgi:hypothetical protein